MNKNEIQLKDIKLIIWDLDETFWKGIISEEKIKFNPQILKFIEDTLNMGIMHSICSKNNLNEVKKELEKNNLWNNFVFPSIEWTPKGERIKNIISTMKLRAENVLFIDDNIQNLNEAKFYCKEIKTELPEKIEYLYVQAEKSEKKDLERKRLKQYKILEDKESLKSNYKSNEEFLMSCNIKVEIYNDCLEQVDRIHELLMRSNQLNYTKFRQSKEDLIKMLNDTDIKSGYVKVHDKFGDYGIVGFFAIKNCKAIHFLFSCRTLGMLVEQWVYKKVGCPEIEVVGETVTKLNKENLPKWINAKSKIDNQRENINAVKNKKIIFKGPCDMMQIFSFIKQNENIITEFTYTNDKGITIEGHNNTAQIVTALYESEEEKEKLINEFSWFDKNMLTTQLSSSEFDVVVLSILPDANLGIYKKKNTNKMISLCEAYYDLTDERNWSKYINEKIFTSNIKFTKNELQKFKNEYEFIKNENGKLTVENLEKIYNKINTKKLILLLGSEKEYKKETKPGYINRHLAHKEINKKVEEWAKGKEGVELINLGKYIENEADYVDSINHFTKRVYYKLAEDIISNINGESSDLKIKNKFSLAYRTLRQRARLILTKIKAKEQSN